MLTYFLRRVLKCWQLLTWGRWVSKITEKVLAYFMDGPYLKIFWTLSETVYLQGSCSLRPCSSRPYCINFISNSPGIGWPANARAAINWACCSWGWRTKGGGWLAAFGYPFPAAWAACWAACAAWAGLLVAAAAAAVIEKKKKWVIKQNWKGFQSKRLLNYDNYLMTTASAKLDYFLTFPAYF